MSSQAPKFLRSSQNPEPTFKITFLFMVELKQRILTSLFKLSDKDTHQIAIEDLKKIIQNLSPDGVSMLLNCLYESTNDPKPAMKKESLHLTVICASYSDSTATHLTKIIAHIVKRLKDSDSGVRDSCCDAIGSFSSQYLKDEGENGRGLGSVVSLFVKPLFEAMNEQTKKADFLDYLASRSVCRSSSQSIDILLIAKNTPLES